MAIMDAKLEFSDAQVISASSASAVLSSNVFSLNSVKDAWGSAKTNDIGEGNNGLVVNLQIATDLNASCRLICKLLTSTASALISSGTELGQVTFAATAAAGTQKQIRVPAGTIYKWLGMHYSVSGSNMTTGAIDAWLGLDHETPSI